jgi:hypothetical protein
MSKVRLQSYFRFAILFLGLQIFTEVQGQHLAVEIRVDPATRKATVSGRFENGFIPATGRNLIFRRAVTGNEKLAERIGKISLKTRDGNEVGSTAIRPGDVLADGDFGHWSYALDVTPSSNRAAAHASWLGEHGGVLMLDDLLPLFAVPGKNVRTTLTLRLPDRWRSFSSDGLGGKDFFDVTDTERSVLFVGDQFREMRVKAKSADVSLLLWGGWHFTDAEAAMMSAEIYSAYAEMFGPLPTQRSQIALIKAPVPENAGQWEAETRGSTVTIVSSDMPFKTQSLQRLHELLRHEIFHLWFPNSVNLKGDYAWFYEGFALYHSLKHAVNLNRIRFDDFLDTLSRAHTIDTNAKPRRMLTDKNIDPTVRYARGMVVAFLTDIDMLKNSGGKRNITDPLKELFARHRFPAPAAEANESVKAVMRDAGIVERYVEGTAEIEWTAELASAGIESNQNGRTTMLKVVANPTGRQKAILDRLGYNNWRKTGNKR